MSFASDIANSVTGNLATDLVKALGRKTSNLAVMERIGRLVNPERLHAKSLDLLEGSVVEGLRGMKEIDPAVWKPILEHPENREQMIGWILSWRDEAEPRLEEWSLENAPNAELLRVLLVRVHDIIQNRKRQVFGPEFFNQLGMLGEITCKLNLQSQRLNEVLDLLKDVLSQTGNREVDRAIEIERRFHRSVALSAVRWFALGVQDEIAQRLANDPARGAIPPGIAPSPDAPLRILIGEIGIGKSLMSERYFQNALAAVAADSTPADPCVPRSRRDRWLT
jgi:hypothetical protein